MATTEGVREGKKEVRAELEGEKGRGKLNGKGGAAVPQHEPLIPEIGYSVLLGRKRRT